MSDMKKNISTEDILLDKQIESDTESKKRFLAWVKDHKKQLIIAGVSTTAIIGVVLGIKNMEALTALWSSLVENIKKDTVSVTEVTHVPIEQTAISTSNVIKPVRDYTSSTNAFDVAGHLRTMSIDKNHSPEKKVEAAAHGFNLLPNQTYVSPYSKGVA